MATVVLIIGALLCLFLSVLSLKKIGMSFAGLIAFALLSALLIPFTAHLFYCLMRFSYAWYDMLPEKPGVLSFLLFWDGNYMLYGGMAGMILAVWLAGKLEKLPTLRALDSVSPWCALMVAVVRLYQGLKGEFYSLELQGAEDDWGETLPTGYEGFPWSVYDEYYEVWHWALYLVAVLLAVILCLVLIRKTRRAPGDRFLLMTGLYASFQIVIEALRRDDVLRWGFIRCSQVISALLVLGVAIAYCVRAGKGHRGKKIASFIMIFAGAGICLLMEFAQEQRIAALSFLSRGACYLISALSCCMIAAAVLLIRSAEAPLPAKE